MAPNSEISFDSQFTVLVGPNGSGKTSVLQALYGCPNRYSTSKFWFSTSMDPIDDGGGESGNRYIYEYTLPSETKRKVEVLKIRRSRKSNPDYWETARPQPRDGMVLDNNFTDEELQFRTAENERWRPVSKPVIYIDFKAEISAFDRFFNFGSFMKRKTIKTKQDYLRLRSSALQKIIEGKSHTFHGRKVKGIEKLSNKALKQISTILGKKYLEASIVYHDLFETEGITIIFKQDDLGYTEAVAGSGEVAVVSCVKKIMDAKKPSLILMDEPEVSLHPGAQIKLREFIFNQIKDKEHQVILTSHSPTLVSGLSPNSIKVFFQRQDGKFDIIPDAEPGQAFVRLGDETYNGIDIIVEDELMKLLVEKALRSLDQMEQYNVKVYPGGGPSIKNTVITSMMSEGKIREAIVLLDGDQKEHEQEFDFSSVTEEQRKAIGDLATQHIGRSLKLPEPSNADKEKTNKKYDLYKKALKIYDSLFFFGNTDIPEELLWTISNLDIIDSVSVRPEKSFYKRQFLVLPAV